MRYIFLSFIILAFINFCPAQELSNIRVQDDTTTFSSVETYILESGLIYWGEKGVGTLFGATFKPEGENLVILCKDTLCVPFYKDDPQNVVVDRKGKSYLLASKVAEIFGYKRVELDKTGSLIRLYKTSKPKPDEPEILPLFDLILPDTSGRKVSLSDYQGKKLILLVWAPWNQSRDSLASWNRFLDNLGKNLHFVFVAETVEGRERLEPYLSLLKPRPTCLVDAGFRITLFYQLQHIPSILLINEKGEFVFGPVKAAPDNQDLHKMISAWGEEKNQKKSPLKGPSIPGYPAPSEIEEAAKRIELAEALWVSGKKEEAITEFKKGTERFKDHEIFKGQLRALLNPSSVYPTPTPINTPRKSTGEAQSL